MMGDGRSVLVSRAAAAKNFMKHSHRGFLEGSKRREKIWLALKLSGQEVEKKVNYHRN
jgi:hypothetical protein